MSLQSKRGIYLNGNLKIVGKVCYISALKLLKGCLPETNTHGLYLKLKKWADSFKRCPSFCFENCQITIVLPSMVH